MNDNPPLPVEFSESDLRALATKWKHMSAKRRLGFKHQCVNHLIGWKRRMGLLPKKPR